MVPEDDQNNDFGPFAADGLVARALRGELKAPEGEVSEELPALAETAWINEDGTVRIHFVTYDAPQSPNRMFGDYELSPREAKHAEILQRHPGLAPEKPNTYTEYHDGRWLLTRAGQVLASGTKSQRQSA
jgi:hypothetical protein